MINYVINRKIQFLVFYSQRPFYSHAASSVMFVKKLEEELRFCVDYRELNIVIIKNRYSLSLIIEILNRLSRIKLFIKLNIIVAFNRLRIKENDEELTIFRIRFDFFEYLIILFELYNDFVSCQHYINDILREHLYDFCIVYFDDILIYSNNELKHEFHVKSIFYKLREAELQTDIIKCFFHVTEVL